MAPFKPRLFRPARSKLNSRLRCYGLTAKEIIEISEIESQVIALTAVKLSLEARYYQKSLAFTANRTSFCNDCIP